MSPETDSQTEGQTEGHDGWPPSEQSPAPAAESRPPPSTGRGDPRLARIEPLLARGQWDQVLELLGPADRASTLPPALALLYAVACKEVAGEKSTTDANFLAIRSTAALLGVPADSRTALVVAKAIMRRSPPSWQSRPAPPPVTRILLVIVALAMGIGAGWLFGPGTVPFKELIRAFTE